LVTLVNGVLLFLRLSTEGRRGRNTGLYSEVSQQHTACCSSHVVIKPLHFRDYAPDQGCTASLSQVHFPQAGSWLEWWLVKLCG
jgi:hypothetical protein